MPTVFSSVGFSTPMRVARMQVKMGVIGCQAAAVMGADILEATTKTNWATKRSMPAGKSSIRLDHLVLDRRSEARPSTANAIAISSGLDMTSRRRAKSTGLILASPSFSTTALNPTTEVVLARTACTNQTLGLLDVWLGSKGSSW
jgi:hypothetical protein